VTCSYMWLDEWKMHTHIHTPARESKNLHSYEAAQYHSKGTNCKFMHSFVEFSEHCFIACTS
jgi:hypothetical protein